MGRQMSCGCGPTTAAPCAWAFASGAVNVMPVPRLDTATPAAGAAASAGEKAIPLPEPRIVVPIACAAASAGENVMPGPALLWSRTAAPLAWADVGPGA